MMDKNIYQPTLIQKSAIPVIIAKKEYDLMGPFLLPIIDELCKLKFKRALPSIGPFALIVAPTRELAQQLGDAAKAYTRDLSLNVVTTYGETSVHDAIREIRRGSDILVATPGRLKQFINEKILNVSTVRWLILDEADKLLQDQFSKDIALLKETLAELNPNHRTFMFSATFDRNIQYLAERLLNPNFFYVSVGSENIISETVQQNFVEAKGFKKVEILHTVLMAYSRGSDTDSRGLEWDRLSLRGIKTMCTNGDRTQQQRQEAIDLFEKGEVDVLVSTNVTARGLNILGVTHISQVSFITKINSDLSVISSITAATK
uniref:RNA helicase n=1 Tax=Ditylenchus dipsaci TaxID=166011 RepID=A0A915CY99_9BILA